MPGVVVCGAMGRMGRAILSVLRERPYGLALAGAVESPGHPLLGHDAFEAAGVGKAGVPVTDGLGAGLGAAGGAIDF